MHGDDDIDWTLLARYFAGDCSAAETAAVERWVAADPARPTEIAALRRWWDDARALPSPARVDAMWTSLSGRMHAGEDTAAAPGAATSSGTHRRPTPVLAIVPRSKPSTTRWRVAVGAIAASLILAVGAALSLRHDDTPT